jgi:TetR/AcrR family transcriptional regulator
LSFYLRAGRKDPVRHEVARERDASAGIESRSGRTRSDRTRAAVLAAAEALFAERGFAATRLEDVAARVGIRRASIVYYFPDKPALYHAVLADVFGELLARIEPALLGGGPLAERAAAAVSAWIDQLAARPSTARILLREVADGRPGHEPPITRHTRAFFELVERALAESHDDPSSDAKVDAVQLASLVAGSTVFFVAAMPALLPGSPFDPLDPERLATLRHQTLDAVRWILAGGTR